METESGSGIDFTTLNRMTLAERQELAKKYMDSGTHEIRQDAEQRMSVDRSNATNEQKLNAAKTAAEIRRRQAQNPQEVTNDWNSLRNNEPDEDIK